MSGLPLKAAVVTLPADVRDVPKADLVRLRVLMTKRWLDGGDPQD
jgi:hypothetical protein